MGTKIFHANSDRETNQFAAELVGKRLQALRSLGSGSSLSFGAQASAGSSRSRGLSESMDFEIQPREFSSLRKGGPENANTADALVFQNGRQWAATGRAWQKAAFLQRPREAAPAPAPPLRGDREAAAGRRSPEYQNPLCQLWARRRVRRGSGIGARSLTAQFPAACAGFLIPGITVLTDGCPSANDSAAWGSVSPLPSRSSTPPSRRGRTARPNRSPAK